MIVKDEGEIICETLANICEHVDLSAWVVADTGSGDDTREKVRAFFAERGVPGKLLEHEWRDFSTNRNAALVEASAAGCDFVFIFDADDGLDGPADAPRLNATLGPCAARGVSAVKVLFKSGAAHYYRPSVVSSAAVAAGWRYRGVLHEAISGVGAVEISQWPCWVRYNVRAGARNTDAKTKYERDVAVLARGVAEEDSPRLRARYRFYLAQSYRCLGDEANSAEHYKWVAGNATSWAQERVVACMTVGRFASLPLDVRLRYLAQGVRLDRSRRECAVAMARLLRGMDMHECVVAVWRTASEPPVTKDKLFVETDANESMELEFHTSISAFYAGDTALARNLTKMVIASSTSESFVNQSKANMQFYTA